MHAQPLEAYSSPGRMRSFIKAVNANTRRYSNPGSTLNVDLTEIDILAMSQKSYDLFWSPAARKPSGNASLLDACVEGESRMATWILSAESSLLNDWSRLRAIH